MEQTFYIWMFFLRQFTWTHLSKSWVTRARGVVIPPLIVVDLNSNVKKSYSINFNQEIFKMTKNMDGLARVTIPCCFRKRNFENLDRIYTNISVAQFSLGETITEEHTVWFGFLLLQIIQKFKMVKRLSSYLLKLPTVRVLTLILTNFNFCQIWVRIATSNLSKFFLLLEYESVITNTNTTNSLQLNEVRHS